jgi:hypothetical protein
MRFQDRTKQRVSGRHQIDGDLAATPPISVYKQIAYLFTRDLPAIEPACIAG